MNEMDDTTIFKPFCGRWNQLHELVETIKFRIVLGPTAK